MLSNRSILSFSFFNSNVPVYFLDLSQRKHFDAQKRNFHNEMRLEK